MSTAQVFQATRSAANTAANQGEFYNAFDPSAFEGTGLNIDRIAGQLRSIAGENQIPTDALVSGVKWFDANGGDYANNARWWGPEATKEAVLRGYAGQNPGFDYSKYIDKSMLEGQQADLGQRLMAQQKGSGGGLFGDLMSIVSDISPVLGVGSLLMGGFDPSSLMSFLGGGESLAGAGGMSFAPGAFSSAFVPNASVAAGGMPGLPSFLSGLGAAAGGASAGEWAGDFGGGGGGPDVVGSDWSGGNASGPTVGNPYGGGGLSSAFQNFMAQNPWAKQLFGGARGAMGNPNNPLVGALMGYANGMLPGTGGPMSNALGMGSGVLSLFQGMDTNRRMRGAYNDLNSMGDPYAALRADAMSRLAALNSNPGGTLANLPGYKAGMDALTRQKAAMGQLGSGNLATALLDYGGNIFNQERGAAMNQLGVAGDPTRLAIIKAQLGSQAGAGNPAIMNGLATLGFGLNRMGL